MMAAPLMISKNLGDLLPGIGADLASLAVTGLALDSRAVQRGDLFMAYQGSASDGRQFIDAAVAAGAAAVLAQSGVELPKQPVPVLLCDALREQVSVIADRFFDHPSAHIGVIGVTGTNGKTSCTQLLGQALRRTGHPCGVIGTLGASLTEGGSGGGLTTPDPLVLQRQLAQWRDQHIPYAALEVSSHGLVQGRISGVRCRIAVFTNLSRDHLDFHGSMEAYGEAKATLFNQAGLECGVINVDDSFGLQLAQRLRPRLPLLTYSLGSESADISASQIQYRVDGVDAKLSTPWGTLQIRSALLGSFNLSNLLAVVAVLGRLGVAPTDIETLVTQLHPIAGRMQRLSAGADIEVVVDYAHTPDALEQVLRALRKHTSGQLWCVFGCGGDRDVGKRPLMGALAEQLADRVVLTSDNPRSESPNAILEQIQAGMHSTPVVEVDRGRAIALAVRGAAPGDTVLLAGKGHEDYQLIGQSRLDFSDVAVAKAQLRARAQL